MMRSRMMFLLGVAVIPATVRAESAADGIDFFEKKVRPILVERCYECHSATAKIKGGLALDTREDWEIGGDAGPAIVPGKPEESLLLKAVSWKDLDLQMPPKKKLSPAEEEILVEWVRRGAPDPRQGKGGAVAKPSPGMSVEEGRKFWSYAPLKDSTPPEVKDAAWPRTDLDRYILAGLEKDGMRPAEDAEPAALARRLSYVLTGLPPVPERITRFVREAAGDRDKAVRTYTDELLATTDHAERWAGHWLDIVRFAESSGGGRTLLFKDAWRYRDYVVDAFARNTPLDRMIREQIAGDLLPWKTTEERARNLTATGFLALGPTIYEEQDKQRLRFDVIDEQVDTIGKAFLGQTIGCARCHDHKFDPVSHADYYSLAGILASTRTLSNYTDNVVTWIEAPLPLPEADERRFATADARLADATALLKTKKNELAALKDKTSGLAGKMGRPIPLSELTGIVLDDTVAKVQGNWKHSRHSPHYFGEGYLQDMNEGKGSKSLAFTPSFPETGRYEVRLAYTPLGDRAKKVPVQIFHALGETTVHVDQTKPPEIEGRFVSLGTYEFEKDGAGNVIISNEGTEGFVCVDLFQLIREGSSDQKVTPAPQTEAIRVMQEEITLLEKELLALKQEQEARPVTMSVREEDEIADTQIRVRGEVHQKAATVPRGFLSVVNDGAPAIPAGHSGRVELGEWLVGGNNPLTSRVMVNRVWAWLFGEGLVRSVDNFGTTGEAPTHPELLDHLAIRFQNEGWDLRKLIREIVASRTWQLAVSADPADPDNRRLSHAHRRRLDAEQIRDTLLTVSGAMDRKVGGPNIKGAKAAPSVSDEASAVEFNYQFDDVRRSLYTPAFRNNRLELFSTFDFSDNNTSQGRRHSSTVAPQALYFMNHPFVIGQARIAGKRAEAAGGEVGQRLERAFMETLGRAPHPAEADACVKLLTASSDADAWSMVYQSLFGSVDFRYLD